MIQILGLTIIKSYKSDTEWDMFVGTKSKFKAYSNDIFVDINAGRYFKMDKRIRLRLGIQFLYACSFALLGFFLML